ncbi:uncharacterized protein At4g08330, chloroplastic [Brachypodium distachyon]|uniref:Protein yippee-like n=1 Tax=Brachypodium distachyon TaxID=15368 RepID=A0A0Q3R321_BRADI|nr:uncharacterized protein At4g08330, chloroplastic [Brachypodium distachyon]KQK07874.1 hypothetical protein BRADI_2g38163v3 [Brachypodium distachyon]|eukprot:XP_003566665.1 uncharacterized protein At4g08330, chloroplastic [Brachypodium distachyon]
MDQDTAKPSPPVLLPRSLSAAVTYCCGACGYDLKLSSNAREYTADGIVGRGRAATVAFGAIDDDRFGHLDEFRCLDVRARRLFARRTRLLCRKCGAHLGFGYDDTAAARRPPRYLIKIRALHPASSDSDGGAHVAPRQPSDE